MYRAESNYISTISDNDPNESIYNKHPSIENVCDDSINSDLQKSNDKQSDYESFTYNKERKAANYGRRGPEKMKNDEFSSDNSNQEESKLNEYIESRTKKAYTKDEEFTSVSSDYQFNNYAPEFSSNNNDLLYMSTNKNGQPHVILESNDLFQSAQNINDNSIDQSPENYFSNSVEDPK